MKTITHIFSRAGEATFALVTCKETDDTDHPSSFLDNLKKAVTEWIKTDVTGETEWENSNEDFNIGDMSLLIGVNFTSKAGLDLTKHLENNGIHNIQILVFAGDSQDLDYDTVLANRKEL